VIHADRRRVEAYRLHLKTSIDVDFLHPLALDEIASASLMGSIYGLLVDF